MSAFARSTVQLLAAVVLMLAADTHSPALAQMGAVGDLALGVALDKLADQLDQAVLDARNSGLAVEIEAGREASIAIADAKNAYAESLLLTVKTLDPSIKGTIDQLQQLVNSISEKSIQSVDAATARAQQIVNSLPLRSGEPQVSAMLPRFVVPSGRSYPVKIRVQGNFVDAARTGYAPYLEINGKRYTSQETTTQALTFLVPASDLFPVLGTSDATKFRSTFATLIVPWRELKFFGLRSIDHADTFKMIIGALPTSPGKIILIHKEITSKVEEKLFASTAYHQCSSRECGNNDDRDHTYAAKPETGWHVVRGSSAPILISKGGEFSGPSFVSDDGDQVVYKVTTIHRGAFGSSGFVNFQISFKESRISSETIEISEEVLINWGDSKSYNYPPGTWKLLFDSFDGHHNEFTGADDSNRLIKLSSQQGAIIVGTREPALLQWP